MARLCVSLCAFLLLAAPGGNALTVSPVQKVIQLLDDLRTKVEAEGKASQQDFAEFAKYCDDEADNKDRAIKDTQAEMSELKATIADASASLANLETKIGDLSGQISAVEAELKGATQNRAAGHESFEEAEKDLMDTADTLAKGATLYKKSTSLLQVKEGRRTMSAAQEARFQKLMPGMKAVVDAGMFRTAGKTSLESFLQARENDQDSLDDEQPAYQQKGGGILEALDGMQEKAEDNLGEERKQEMKDQHAFAMLEAAMQNELKNLNDELALSTSKKQTTTETLAKAQKALSAAEKGLEEDTKYLADLKHDCQEKAAEYEEEYRDRTNELAALAKAKAILDGKFAASSAAASFIQLKATTRSKAKAKAATDLWNLQEDNKAAALRMLHRLGKELHSVVLVSLSFRASADPFAKVRGMIEDMISKLLQEAAEEANQKAFCDKELKEAKASVQSNSEKLDTANARIAKAEAQVEKLTGEISSLTAEVTEMDNALGEAMKIRLKEREVYRAAVKDYSDSQEACAAAMQVLRDYYEGGTSFLQMGMRTRARSSVWDTTTSASRGDGSGVIGMLEVAESDFATLLAEAKATEEVAVEEFAKMQTDTKVLKATKLAEAKGKKTEIAGLKNSLMNYGEDRDGVSNELDAVLAYLDKLKPQCDNAGPSYEERKARREKELEGLKNALDILDGGVPVFLQERTRLRRGIHKH